MLPGASARSRCAPLELRSSALQAMENVFSHNVILHEAIVQARLALEQEVIKALLCVSEASRGDLSMRLPTWAGCRWMRSVTR